MRYLSRIGLVPSLVIVGALGGLMAPLPSEATPSLTLQVDGLPATPVSILNTTSATCNAAEKTLGYTACYGIKTSTSTVYTGTNSRSYTVQNAPGLTARLRVADLKGQDKFSLVGVQFVPHETDWGPDANTNESHVLTITMHNVFNSSVNVNNAGTYKWALTTAGEFDAGPTTAVCSTSDNVCDSIKDTVVFTGKGIFDTSKTTSVDILSPAGSAQNSQPLSFTVGGPHLDPILAYAGLTNTDMGQVDPTYPQFTCTNGATSSPKCVPDITLTMTATLYGPDTFVVVAGQDAFAANCAETLSPIESLIIALVTAGIHKYEADHPNPTPPQQKFINFVESTLASINAPHDSTCPGTQLINIDKTVAQVISHQYEVGRHAVYAQPAAAQTATIRIKKYIASYSGGCFDYTQDPPVLQPCGGVTFGFHITGPTNTTVSITTAELGSGFADVTVEPGTYTVTEDTMEGWGLVEPDATCEGGPTTSGFVVSSGATAICAFTNDPTIN